MTSSHIIRKSAWQLFVALRIAFVVLAVSGIVLLVMGKDYAIFLLMFGLLLGYAAVFRRCASCGKHVAVAGSFWLAFANPFARRCMHCGYPIRKPHDA